MRCEAARKTLTFAEDERTKALLREVMESQRALYDLGHSLEHVYDWGSVKRAANDVRCWEARCNGAEAALKRCEEEHAKNGAAIRP